MSEVLVSDEFAQAAVIVFERNLVYPSASSLWSSYRHMFTAWLRMQGLATAHNVKDHHALVLDAVKIQMGHFMPTIISNADDVKRLRRAAEYHKDTRPTVDPAELKRAIDSLPLLELANEKLFDELPIFK